MGRSTKKGTKSQQGAQQTTLFDQRLARYYDELKWLYCELYNGDTAAFDYFLNMLRRCWDERKEDLRAQDARREANPDWYRQRELLGMMLYTGAFAGTLEGVKEKLPYLEECGVNYLHLMPLLESPKGRSDGGYAVANFRRVQPELGTMEDLEALADACRAKGMSLCLDFVMNHTSEDHEWPERPGLVSPATGNGISSMIIGTLPTSLRKPFLRCSPPPLPAASPGCQTAIRWS